MATIRIPTPLRGYAGNNAAVQVSGETVGQLLDGLTSQYPDLRRHLFKDEGTLRNFVSIFLNDEDIRHAGGLDATVTDADEVSIVPSIAGGATESRAEARPPSRVKSLNALQAARRLKARGSFRILEVDLDLELFPR